MLCSYSIKNICRVYTVSAEGEWSIITSIFFFLSSFINLCYHLCNTTQKCIQQECLVNPFCLFFFVLKKPKTFFNNQKNEKFLFIPCRWIFPTNVRWHWNSSEKNGFFIQKNEIPMIKCAGFSEYFPPPHTSKVDVYHNVYHTQWKEKEEKLLHII